MPEENNARAPNLRYNFAHVIVNKERVIDYVSRQSEAAVAVARVAPAPRENEYDIELEDKNQSSMSISDLFLYCRLYSSKRLFPVQTVDGHVNVSSFKSFISGLIEFSVHLSILFVREEQANAFVDSVIDRKTSLTWNVRAIIRAVEPSPHIVAKDHTTGHALSGR